MPVSEERIERVLAAMAERELDTFMVSIEENRRYLSGFTAEDTQFDESAGVLLITAGGRLLLATDSRFEIQAKQEAPMFELIIYRKALSKELPSIVDKLDSRRLGFESARMSVRQFNDFQRELGEAGRRLDLVPTENVVEALRLTKSPEEIEKTRSALALAEEVFGNVVAGLKPGMTEKQIAWAMDKGMRESGGDAVSFATIVAAGPNAALPHAIPTDRPIREGEPILFDWGVKLNGYHSDTSRTVILGQPDDTFLKVHGTVLAAQQKAIAAIRAGVGSKSVDAVARGHIEQNGFAGKFGHGLGHGTGLAVHEGPRLSPTVDTELKSGTIVTVEPGIYLEGWGGVRIENQVVVTENGPMVLNRLDETYDIDRIKVLKQGF